MAKDSGTNGWEVYQKVVLERLDRHERLLTELGSDGKDTNRKVNKLCTIVAVMQAKAGVIAAFVTIILTGAYHLFLKK